MNDVDFQESRTLEVSVRLQAARSSQNTVRRTSATFKNWLYRLRHYIRYDLHSSDFQRYRIVKR